jgi:hypothetical protein
LVPLPRLLLPLLLLLLLLIRLLLLVHKQYSRLRGLLATGNDGSPAVTHVT